MARRGVVRPAARGRVRSLHALPSMSIEPRPHRRLHLHLSAAAFAAASARSALRPGHGRAVHLLDRRCGQRSSRVRSRTLVSAFADKCRVPMVYCVEPRQNIALARNKAVEHATRRLRRIHRRRRVSDQAMVAEPVRGLPRYEADGVLGPVKPHFDEHAAAVGRRRRLLRASDVSDRLRDRLAQGAHRQRLLMSAACSRETRSRSDPSS